MEQKMFQTTNQIVKQCQKRMDWTSLNHSAIHPFEPFALSLLGVPMLRSQRSQKRTVRMASARGAGFGSPVNMGYVYGKPMWLAIGTLNVAQLITHYQLKYQQKYVWFKYSDIRDITDITNRKLFIHGVAFWTCKWLIIWSETIQSKNTWHWLHKGI